MRYRLLTAAVLLGLSGLFARKAPAQGAGLERKSCFAREHPVILSFRGERGKLAQNDYDAWRQALEGKQGLLRKFIPEEVAIAPLTPGFANRYVREHPDKLMLLHLNGEARQVCEFSDVREKYFPGHWVYMEGSEMTGRCKATDTQIKVSNIKPFLNKGYAVRKSSGRTFLPLMVILVPQDENGGRLWYESEFAEVSSVDMQNKAIGLKRGVYGSEALDFNTGNTYVAPVAGGLWGKYVMFYYNLSSVCPKDRNGRQAKDVYCDEIAGWFSKGGVLEKFDGIAFDVNYFDVSKRGRKWDVDNDGKADGGWINGHNVWKEGDIDFMSRLRRKAGDDFIISADGQHEDNQQLTTVIDGIESEGLVQHNDMWRGFSRAMNTHLFWMDHCTSPYDFRYVVMKLTGKDVQNADRCRRFGASAAFCLDAAITIPTGEDKKQNPGFEFLPSTYRAPGSLGRTQGPLLRYYKNFEPVAKYSGKELKIDADSNFCTLVRKKNTISLAFADSRANAFKIGRIDLPGGDVVIEVDVRLDEYPSELEAEFKTPGTLWLRPENLPRYDKSKSYNECFTDIYGFISERGDQLTYYFRNVRAGTQNLQLKVKDVLRMTINSIRIYNAPDIVMREFENAAVIVNPSLQAVRIRVRDFFPHAKINDIEVPAIDAVFVDLN